MRPKRQRMAKGTLTRIRRTKQIIRQLYAYANDTSVAINFTPKGLYVTTLLDGKTTFHAEGEENCPNIVKVHMEAVGMLSHILGKNTNLIKLKSNRQYFRGLVLNTSKVVVKQCDQ